MAIINEAYGPQGQADYEVYPLAAKEPSAFHDITLGTNQMPCQAASPNCTNGELTGYAATPGRSGHRFGSINADTKSSTGTAAVRESATTTTLTSSSSSFAHGTAVTLKPA